jgi:hypothetical protein
VAALVVPHFGGRNAEAGYRRTTRCVSALPRPARGLPTRITLFTLPIVDKSLRELVRYGFCERSSCRRCCATVAATLSG